MKKFIKFILFVALVPALTFTSCKKDSTEEPVVPGGNFTTLKAHLVSQNLDLPTLLTGWVIDPKLIADGGIVDPTDYSIPGYNVVDIRPAADFATGHIKGAVNSTLGGILETAQTLGKTKPILVACATGQTAGVAVMALRLSGYADAKVMKFGMAYWNDQFAGPWNSAIGNQGEGNSNWVNTASPSATAFSYPTWTSTSTDGAALLSERVKSVLAAGFVPVASADVLANPSSYSIINYWPAADYTTFGHFSGALQLGTITLAADEIKNINPAKETLLYCYTGMTSAYVSTYLNILGYNVKSIKFGANALVHQKLKDGGKTFWDHSKNYPLVTGN